MPQEIFSIWFICFLSSDEFKSGLLFHWLEYCQQDSMGISRKIEMHNGFIRFLWVKYKNIYNPGNCLSCFNCFVLSTFEWSSFSHIWLSSFLPSWHWTLILFVVINLICIQDSPPSFLQTEGEILKTFRSSKKSKIRPCFLWTPLSLFPMQLLKALKNIWNHHILMFLLNFKTLMDMI